MPGIYTAVRNRTFSAASSSAFPAISRSRFLLLALAAFFASNPAVPFGFFVEETLDGFAFV